MLYKGLQLDRFQEEAIEAINKDASVIVTAPTGAGKTVIAEYAVEKCIEENRRVIYTAPIKALSNQKYRDFYAEYGDKIGIVTGDVVLNPYAQVLLMTTEIFRNTIFDDIERYRMSLTSFLTKFTISTILSAVRSGKKVSSSHPNISNSSV